MTLPENRRDEVREWERDWRSGVTSQLSDTAKTLSDVVGVVREMKDDLHELRAWKNELEKRRDDRIEKAPDNQRANWALILSAGMFLIYLLTFMSQHWKP